MRWTVKFIDETKNSVKEELDTVESADGPEARLRACMEKIAALADDVGPEALLRRFVYCASAMVCHVRNGGLTRSKIDDLFNICHTILKVQNIAAGNSVLDVLYRDLFSIYSQAIRRDGEHWEATWYQQISSSFTGRSSVDSDPLYELGTAIRMQRIGLTSDALELYRTALDKPLNRQQIARSHLGIVRCLRLSGDYIASREAIASALDKVELDEAEDQNFAWEELCLNAVERDELVPLLRSVSKTGTHYLDYYYLEAYLWATVKGQVKSNLDLLAKLSSMARARSLAVHQTGYSYNCVKAIADCYDTEIPFIFRLEGLGRALKLKNKLLGVDFELLFLAASFVFLRRNKSQMLGKIVHSEYESLCMRLTKNTNGDILDLNT